MVLDLAKDVLEKGMILRIDKYHADERRAFKVWVELDGDGNIHEVTHKDQKFDMHLCDYLYAQLENQLHDYIECHIADKMPSLS